MSNIFGGLRKYLKRSPPSKEEEGKGAVEVEMNDAPEVKRIKITTTVHSHLSKHNWTVDVKDVLKEPAGFRILEFQTGEKIDRPSNWEVYLKTNHDKDEIFLGIILRCLNRTDFPSLDGKFKITLKHPTDPKQNIICEGEPADFSKVEGWGLLKLVDSKNIPEFQSEDGDISLVLDFNLLTFTKEIDPEPHQNEAMVVELGDGDAEKKDSDQADAEKKEGDQADAEKENGDQEDAEKEVGDQPGAEK